MRTPPPFRLSRGRRRGAVLHGRDRRLAVCSWYPQSFSVSVGRVPGCSSTRGAISLSNYTLPQRFTNVYKYSKIVSVNYGAVEVDVGKLKELRINAGLSQRELATRAGLTPGAVWQVEHRGSGSPATLKKIADVLGVRPVDLLTEGR